MGQEKWHVASEAWYLGLVRRLMASKGVNRFHCYLWQHELTSSIHQSGSIWTFSNLRRHQLCHASPGYTKSG